MLNGRVDSQNGAEAVKRASFDGHGLEPKQLLIFSFRHSEQHLRVDEPGHHRRFQALGDKGWSRVTNAPFLAALDVHYFETHAHAACVVASDWSDAAPLAEYTARHDSPADYEPGAFFKRELPPLLAVLGRLPELPPILVVDGYVWLDLDRPGLGYHLQQALPQCPAVVGVAKTSFAGNRAAVAVLRGSTRPLFVTAVGLDVEAAAEHVRDMAGQFRLPDLLRRADQLAKGRT